MTPAASPRRAGRYDPPDDLSRIRARALLVGAVAALPCLAGGMASPAQFFRSYLVAYIYWLSVALGCLAIAMLQHL